MNDEKKVKERRKEFYCYVVAAVAVTVFMWVVQSC